MCLDEIKDLGVFKVLRARLEQFMDPTRAPHLEFEAMSWCPIFMFGVNLDFIPWGMRKTTMSNNGFTVNGLEGPFGIRHICKDTTTSAVLA